MLLEDTVLDIHPMDHVYDPDNDALTISDPSSPTYGNIQVLSTAGSEPITWRYTPPPNFNTDIDREASFSFVATDAFGASTTVVLKLDIMPGGRLTCTILYGATPMQWHCKCLYINKVMP